MSRIDGGESEGSAAVGGTAGVTGAPAGEGTEGEEAHRSSTTCQEEGRDSRHGVL